MNAVLAVLLALSAPSGEREEALLSAVRSGDVAAVKALLDQGVPVDTRFRYDRTALSFAADRGNLEMVTLLLDRGADVQIADTFYNSRPVSRAAEKGHLEVVRLLLARGATVDDGMLFGAVAKANEEMLELALTRGKPRPELLSSLLERAERANAAPVVARLRRAGAVLPPKADFIVDAAVLARYAGKYQEDGKEEVITLSIAEGALQSSLGGGPARKLSAIDAATFRDMNAFGLVTVEIKLEGERAQGLTLSEIGKRRSFKRMAEQ